MTLADSILLQISQKRTSFNDLLTRIMPNYSSTASARAALSRAIKNLVAFENIIKKEDFYEITDKGKKIVESKLKNKMLIIINDLLKKSKATTNLVHLDDIIKNIQIFLERSKEDPTLLMAGKSSATFYISDLAELKESIEKRISNLNRLGQALDKQILFLKELNFEDMVISNLDSAAFEIIAKLINLYSVTEIIIDCDKDDINSGLLFENHYEFIRKPDNVFILKSEDLNALKKLVLTNLESIMQTRFKIYIKEAIIYLKLGKLYYTAPYEIINQIREAFPSLNKTENISITKRELL
jgi:hypothetical protein